MKSPWDAYRVASGLEHEKDTEFDPLLEMTISKCIEIFAESIPAVMIQFGSILQSLSAGDDISYVALVSVVLSTFTTGFVSATISYDFDTDPSHRAEKPDFYGYVPESASRRVLLFFTMTNLSAVQALIKSLLVVTLGIVNPMYA